MYVRKVLVPSNIEHVLSAIYRCFHRLLSAHVAEQRYSGALSVNPMDFVHLTRLELSHSYFFIIISFLLFIGCVILLPINFSLFGRHSKTKVWQIHHVIYKQCEWEKNIIQNIPQLLTEPLGLCPHGENEGCQVPRCEQMLLDTKKQLMLA